MFQQFLFIYNCDTVQYIKHNKEEETNNDYYWYYCYYY